MCITRHAPTVLVRTLVVGLVTINILGCESLSWTSRETGAFTGAALGAGLGAIVGNQVGSTGAGVAVGSAFGAVSGALVGESVRKSEEESAFLKERLNDQKQRLEDNQLIIQKLRQRGADVHEGKRGVIVNLPDVLFDFNSSRLRSSAFGTVQDIAHVLNDFPNRRISVEGHTDSLGTIEYNDRLSLQRAKNVANTLQQQGITNGRLLVKGLGESRPLASNATREGRQRNRRVEVILEN
jgi:outer membrane protein OmpA-like peptidoglycan-associated protein